MAVPALRDEPILQVACQLFGSVSRSMLAVAARRCATGSACGGAAGREESIAGAYDRFHSRQLASLALNDAPPDTLSVALARHRINLDEEAIALLDRYCRALWSWNEKLNLTRHTDYDKFVARDVVDSLALEPFLDTGATVLDVGTGGGVPGIVLAIVRPDLEVSLCDSVAKRVKAVAAIVDELELDVRVFHAPVQEVLVDGRFDILVARAVAPLAKLLRWLAPHWESFDRLLVIKGPAWIEERAAAREAGLLKHVALARLASYPLPGTESESVVLSLRPKSA